MAGGGLKPKSFPCIRHSGLAECTARTPGIVGGVQALNVPVGLPPFSGQVRLVSALAAFLFLTPAAAQPIIAVDGDTIAVGHERIRILGLDTPETYFAKCPAEQAKGYEAAGRLQYLLNERRVRIERTGRKDKYRRTLARVYVGGEDVAAIMIREGRARPNSGEKRKPWC